MSHPRNMPKQDLVAQYYSRRLSSVALNSNSSSSPPLAASASASSYASPSTSSPLNITITARQEAMMDDKGNQTVEKLMNRAGALLKEWEIKKGTPTATMNVGTMAEEGVKKVTSSPTPKLRTGSGHYRDWDGKAKPVAVVEKAIQEETDMIVMKTSERESLAEVLEDEADAAAMEEKDEVGRRMESHGIISSSPPEPTNLAPIQEDRSPSPVSSASEINPSVPAVPLPPTRPPFKEPKLAANTPLDVSAPTGAPKEWKPKHKIHDWFCASHKASTSTLAPYKCTRCTKRRAASKSSLEK